MSKLAQTFFHSHIVRIFLHNFKLVKHRQGIVKGYQ